MNARKTKRVTIGVLSIILITSCSGEHTRDISPEPKAEFGSINLSFDNVVGAKELILTSETYTNASEENYSVSELKYILSNFVLINKAGEFFEYPKEASYVVINESDPTSLTFKLDNIPAGEYTQIKFGFGVDQSKYPIEQGTLNFVPKAEELGMLWGWAAGFKFIKFEGQYTTVTNTEKKDFLVHVGSHGAVLNNYKDIVLPTPEFKINNSETIDVALKVDVAEFFDSTTTMSLQNADQIQIDPVNAPLYAANAAYMFSIATIK